MARRSNGSRSSRVSRTLVFPPFVSLIFFNASPLPECHEQNPHHHGALCCHESVSNVLGAEGPYSQRLVQSKAA